MLLDKMGGENNGNFRLVVLMKEKLQEKLPFGNYMKKHIKEMSNLYLEGYLKSRMQKAI